MTVATKMRPSFGLLATKKAGYLEVEWSKEKAVLSTRLINQDSRRSIVETETKQSGKPPGSRNCHSVDQARRGQRNWGMESCPQGMVRWRHKLRQSSGELSVLILP